MKYSFSKINRHLSSKAMSFTRSCILVFLMLFSLVATAQSGANKACIECHKETVDKQILHGPTVTDCTSCHESNGEKHPNNGVAGFKLYDKGAELCYSCHVDNKVAFKQKYVHKPLKTGDCTGCHDVHSSSQSQLVSAPTPELCVSCHKDFAGEVKETAKSVHTASFEGESCTQCHTPHASKIKRLLVAKSKDLCLKCHDKEIEKEDGYKIANIGKHLDENSHKHRALKKRCSGCHDPHFSKDQSILLKHKYPLGNYTEAVEESYTLCFNCHDTDILNVEKTIGGTFFRNGEENLHYLHINKIKGRTCKNCHDVHAANNTKLIAKTVKFGRWDMPLNFVETENGGSCATGCHKEQSYSRGATPITNEE